VEVRAQLHLRQILVDLNVYPINEPQLLLARTQDSFDSDLKLKDLAGARDIEEYTAGTRQLDREDQLRIGV